MPWQCFELNDLEVSKKSMNRSSPGSSEVRMLPSFLIGFQSYLELVFDPKGIPWSFAVTAQSLGCAASVL